MRRLCVSVMFNVLLVSQTIAIEEADENSMKEINAGISMREKRQTPPSLAQIYDLSQMIKAQQDDLFDYLLDNCEDNQTKPNVSTVVKTLSVTNGERFGSWGEEQYCPKGTYAVGYDMKIEGKQGGGDDTSLNGIELICQAPNGPASNETVSSSVGSWGDWVGSTSCDTRGGKQHFLVSFKLQVEQWEDDNDDTSANYVKFKCRDFAGSLPTYELYKGTGFGFWGGYGSWSSECALDSAICGIKTKIEPYQGSGDDTALNDVQFLCCN